MGTAYARTLAAGILLTQSSISAQLAGAEDLYADDAFAGGLHFAKKATPCR
jgi:hypothetical protein